MTTQTQYTRRFVRATILGALVAVLALTSAQRAGAQQSKITTIYDNASAQMALCELAGGKADVEETHTLDGYPANTVTCVGGLLDGMVCSNNSGGTACHFAWLAPEVDDGIVAPIDDAVEVAPEPTQPPIIIDEPIVLEPVVDPGMGDSESAGESVEPEPSPTTEPILDAPEVVDEIAPPTEGTDDGGRELPELQDGVVIDEIFEPGKGEDSGKGEPPVIVDTIDLSVPVEAPVAG